MMNRSQQPFILMIMLMAIILAIGLFLAFIYLRNRPENPPGVRTETVEGLEITINMDDSQEALLVPLGAAPVSEVPQATSEQPVLVEPTADPALQQPTQAIETAVSAQQPVVEQPTATIQVIVPTAPPATVAPVPAAASIIFIDYAVQANDTLYGITQRYATSIALMSVNGISQANLVPGTIIKLPIGNPDYCPGRRPYAIGEGDTAFSIARQYGITAEELRTINNLDVNYTVRVAEVICVP